MDPEQSLSNSEQSSTALSHTGHYSIAPSHPPPQARCIRQAFIPGMYQVSTRYPQGIHKGSTRDLQGIHKGYTRDIQGIYKGSTKDPQGTHKGSTRDLVTFWSIPHQQTHSGKAFCVMVNKNRIRDCLESRLLGSQHSGRKEG